GDPVLSLLRSLERVGIDVLQANKDPIHSRASGLFDEAADLVAHGVDLRDDVDALLFLLSHPDQPVEDRLPVLVACEVVVGDEEIVDALRQIGPHDALDVIRPTATRLVTLHVDDGTEAAMEGAAAPRI